MLLMQMNLFGSMAMKKYILIAAMAAMAIVAGSCAKEQDSLVDKPASANQNLVKMHFTARTEGTPTKTTLNTSTGAVSWAAGDAIKMVWELNGVADSSVSDELSAGNISAGKAEFTAEVPDKFAMTEAAYKDAGGSSLHLYAVYPSSMVTDYSTASSFYLTVPTVQDGSFEHASIALAKWDKTNPSAPLEFKNLCGLLQIVIADNDVRKIILHSSDYIAGKMNISFTGPAVNAVEAGEKDITVNVSGAGTYYVAVLPTNDAKGIGVNNLYVELLDSSDELIGDKSTSNPLVINRKQIRKLGTVATGFSDRFYVKSGATGSGASWSDAAGLSSLVSLMATNVTKNIYMAAGTYSLSAEMKVNQDGASIKIYGGFPSGATGYSLSGQDIEANETIIDCGNTYRGIVATKGSTLIDGITIQNAAKTDNSTPGSVLVIQGATSFSANNCKFLNNTHTSTGTLLGVVRLASTTASFTNCLFEGNSSSSTSGSTKYGSVIYQYPSATLSMDNCEFYDNTAGSFGTVLYTKGASTIRNCTFGKEGHGNTSTSRGGVICMDDTADLSITDSEFTANSGAIGGAIYVNAIANTAVLSVSNTIFSSNTATNTSNGGGAVGISGDSKTYSGMLAFNNCDFDSNSTLSCGGAVWANGASVSFTDCNFTSNTVTAAAASENGLGGGAVYSASSGATRIFFNRCYFAQNNVGTNGSANKKWGHHLDFNSETAIVGINNCVIKAPWAVTLSGDSSYKGIGSLITTRAYTAIVNSTIYSQTGNAQVTQGSKDNAGFSIINSIIINAAGTPNNFANPDASRYMNIHYSLYNQVRSGSDNNISFSNSLGGVTYSDLKWTKAGNGTSISSGDVRDHYYVYDWSGSIDGKTFANPTLDQVKAVLSGTTNVGPAFLTWLGDSNLSVDIRGAARDTDAMWPGSYQGTGTKASIESLNVR